MKTMMKRVLLPAFCALLLIPALALPARVAALDEILRYEITVDVNEDGTLRVHPKGEFIYRLAGREREKSASYYTPEVLTKCLVKYALKELLEGRAVVQGRITGLFFGTAGEG